MACAISSPVVSPLVFQLLDFLESLQNFSIKITLVSIVGVPHFDGGNIIPWRSLNIYPLGTKLLGNKSPVAGEETVLGSKGSMPG